MGRAGIADNPRRGKSVPRAGAGAAPPVPRRTLRRGAKAGRCAHDQHAIGLQKMPHSLLATDAQAAVPVWAVSEDNFAEIAPRLSAPARAFAAAQGFEPKPGSHCLLPSPDGGLEGVLFGLDGPAAKRPDPFLPGKLATV